ncbi:hypothetical protein Rvan_1252 [Rhodomicrobium vannielii ATCC 17100]|uniref:Uncharacterized protein n=1 Tax=Rhodomicrobium vannielii (strain ATCC 17100 / DSM 162 / LMG 4299 / NCIMB 10020 / ATH 3.1.1) TaxID=648757 RepID=E3I566_RHOVT|nr:hypothetical protein [Rhodomicrobium vannielii]ADP70516.1 hypothetical protein Rvan_1252 [Rhodomicrobium vannielii ATCC 17100]
MAFSARRVMIPLASAGDAGGRIAHIRADGVKPANDAKLIPEIVLLNDCRLYRAGEVAAAAIRELGLASDNFVTRFGLHRRAYLSPVNAPDLRALSSNNSSSAQLGLALAILMYEGQSEASVAIATGQLATHESLHSFRDVPVKPVGSMGEKIEAIRTYLEDHMGSAIAPRIPFLFPATTPEGEETLLAYRVEFERLRETYRDHGVDLQLHPVSHLREALAVLRIKGPSLDPFYGLILKRSFAALCILTAVSLSVVAFKKWLDRPIRLEFADIELSGGETVPSPFPIVRRNGVSLALPVCLDSAGRAIYPTNTAIALRAQIKNPSSWSDWIAPYHFAVLTVSAKSGVKVFSPGIWGGEVGVREVSISLSIKDVEESNKLVVLARRWTAFDTVALKARLAEVAGATSADDRINAVINAAVSEAPGYLDYSFLTEKGPPKCL